MNYKMIGKFIGRIMLIEAAFLLPACGISIFQGEKEAVQAFAITIFVSAAVGGLLTKRNRGTKKGFHAREGLVCVGISWIVLGLTGALPFFFVRCDSELCGCTL